METHTRQQEKSAGEPERKNVIKSEHRVAMMRVVESARSFGHYTGAA